jgi:hypothetical protein
MGLQSLPGSCHVIHFPGTLHIPLASVALLETITTTSEFKEE